MSNAGIGNLTQVDLDCPQFSEQSERIVSGFSFWVEGVTQVTANLYMSKLHSPKVKLRGNIFHFVMILSAILRIFRLASFLISKSAN